MDLKRIWATFEYDFILLKRNKHRLMQMFYVPLATLLVWGFFAIYARQFAFQAALTILSIQIFWQFSFLSQSTVSMQILEDIWSRSLREILSSPLTAGEFLIARSLSSMVRAFVSLLIVLFAAQIFFDFNFLANFWTIISLSSLTLLASLGLGILIVSVILRFGQSLSFLAWGIAVEVMFLSAPFYPLSILPQALQYIAYGIPYTWIFEAIKSLVGTGTVGFNSYLLASSVSVFYFLISFPIFFYVFEKARESGRLIRLWAG